MSKDKKGKTPRPRGEPKLSSDSKPLPSLNKEIKKTGTVPRKKARQMTKWRRCRRWLLSFFLRLVIAGSLVSGIFLFYIYTTLPDISTLGEVKKTPSIIVKAEDGTVVGTYGDVYGDYVPYGQLPKTLINAVVATEDRNFFHHYGVDPIGLMRASYVNIKAKRLVQGGSTITQQVAKNVFLTPERKLRRKLQEMLLAIELEHRYSKEEILTIYLNRVYMGAGNYGVDSASRRYFGHSVRNITLDEAAILVGLLKAPSRYAPTNNPDLSEKRATQVLINMQSAGYLTANQVEEAKSSFNDEDSNYRDSHSYGAFYFSDWVVGQLEQLPEYTAYSKEDLIITTTLKPEWQHFADDAVATILQEKGKALRASQAALVSMSPDGAIRAMVGGKSYRASQFNRATQGLRQPGSSFKLFVYLAGLESGFLPDSEMVDQPLNIGNWHPRNYSGKYEGPMTLRKAFAQSTNSIAVQLSETVGRGKVVEMAQRLGITSDVNPDPSIALGTSEVTLLDMTRAYAHLASNGLGVVPYTITHIQTADGRLVYEKQTVQSPQIVREPIVKMMNNMLISVTETGTGRGARFGRPIAGKTGTTSDYRDAWFMGFTPEVVTGVWVGNDDTAPMKKVSGGSLPASIWRQYMMNALKGVAVAQIPNQSDNGSGSLLPWFNATGSENNSNSSPKALQNTPAFATSPPVAEAQDPEEEPTPEYNAPSSFWDKLLGDGKR